MTTINVLIWMTSEEESGRIWRNQAMKKKWWRSERRREKWRNEENTTYNERRKWQYSWPEGWSNIWNEEEKNDDNGNETNENVYYVMTILMTNGQCVYGSV